MITTMRFWLSLLLSLLAGLAIALPGAAATETLASPSLPAGWSHAEINVTIRHVPHTLVYDRGRVTAVTSSSLTLLERDGNVASSVVIDVSPTAQITIAGQPGTLADIRPLEIATTLSIDGAAATKVTVQIPPRVAAAIAGGRSRRL